MNRDIPEFAIGLDGHIPAYGIGTYGLTETDLKILFSHYPFKKMLIDTAAKYVNEELIARALEKCNRSREDVFLTSKISYQQQECGSVKTALESTLANLKTTYLDLYLIHSPRYLNYTDTWLQIIELQSSGLLRHIGVSNFDIPHILELYYASGRWPEVNQLALSPFDKETNGQLLQFCKEKNILVEAAMPFGGEEKKTEWSRHSRAKYIRTLFDNNIVVIPGTKKSAHLLENISALQKYI